MAYRHKAWVSTLAFVMSAAMVKAQANQQLIAQLDAASKRFQNVQADVTFDTYTSVVKEHDTSNGIMFVERQDGSESMSAKVTDAGSSNSAKILNYSGGVLQVYTPSANQVDIFKAGANQSKYESFLTLGFGGSGKDLAQAWNITDKGAETIDGVQTEKLELVAKDSSVKNMFSLVTIWVDLKRDVSLKQIFLQPNGDSRTAIYKITQFGGTINKKPYAIDSKAHKFQH